MSEDKEDMLQRILSEHASMRQKVKDNQKLEAERRLEADLKAIRKIDPKVKGIEDLGEEFFELSMCGKQFCAVRTSRRLRELAGAGQNEN